LSKQAIRTLVKYLKKRERSQNLVGTVKLFLKRNMVVTEHFYNPEDRNLKYLYEMKPACKGGGDLATCGFVVGRFSLYYAAKANEHVYQGSFTSQIGLHSDPPVNPRVFLRNLVKLT
jgi:hypothetical protein